MRLCAVVPTHDHWRALPDIVAQLREVCALVIVVDDGSGEPARTEIAKLDGVHLIRFDLNRGKGAAVVAGLREAHAQGFTHALQVDADGQHDLDALPRLIEAAERQPGALISGQPLYDASMPLGRRIGRWVTHAWVWIETLSFRITDSMCGFRIYPLAPVMALLERQSVGARMDFDTEIMVRLFWMGVAPVMVPVRVTYPPDNHSNFAMLADNVRISAMHTRLVFGMLARALGPVPAEGGGRWAQLAERGAGWGLAFTAWCYRQFGRRACLAVLAPVVLYFYLTASSRREATRAYLTRALGRPAHFLDGYWLFLSFAARTVDILMAWTGGWPKDALAFADPARLKAALTDPRGAVVVVAHFGNAEIARALLDAPVRRRMTILVHTKNARKFQAILTRWAPEAALNLIEVTEIGPETTVLLRERVAQGEWICIAGDRTPVMSQGRVVKVPFLGDDAPFPVGPWVLASLLQCPVHLLFCTRQERRWLLELEPFAERIILPRATREATLHELVARYADRLAAQVRSAPWQWYNFYDFWAG